jgi:hypothetical protein
MPREDLLEALERLTSNALRWRVGSHQRGVGGLNFAEFAQEQVVVAVRNRRCRVLIITLVVREDLGSELKCAKFRGHVCEGVDNGLEAAYEHATHGG